MTAGPASLAEDRVLVLMPTSQDSARTAGVLREAQIVSTTCGDLSDLCHELRAGAGALLLTDETLLGDTNGQLAEALRAQAAWSTVPVVVLARGGASQYLQRDAADALPGLVLVERPARMRTLLSVVQSALRGRRQQYQIRDAVRERERQAAAAIAQDERMRFALAAGGLGAWDLDLATNELECSALGKANFGRAAGEPFSWADLRASIHPDDRERVAAALDRCVATGADYDVEYRVAWPDASSHWVMVRGRARYDRAGVPRSVAGVSQDVTERRRIDEALHRSRSELARQAEQLRNADRLKDEFLATLAHELRNPLAPIRTGLDLLSAGPAAPVAERALGMMHRQVGHMVRLIDDLLDVSRITRGKLELRRERVDVRSLIDAAVETSRPLFERAGQTLRVSVAEQPLVLDADLMRCAQVVSNLLNNASRYTPAGGTITLSARADGGDAVIRVIDDGAGIPGDRLQDVFEMFSQVNRTLEQSRGGLGIGLALVRRLVEMHGGTVIAASDGVGRGSTFTVRLPLAVAADTVAAVRAEGRPEAPPATDVLVVDDNEDAAELLALMLTQAGHTTVTAHDGPAALELAKQAPPKVVFLDIGMPGMNGYEVARRMREDERLAHAALIAVTGWGTAEDKRKAIEAGFDVHLTKPVDASDVRGALEQVARRGPRE